MTTRPEFLAALEAALQQRGKPFRRADVLAFVEAAWPLIEEDPSPGRWAGEFSAAAAKAEGVPDAVRGKIEALLEPVQDDLV
jgi:hypothetical protein